MATGGNAPRNPEDLRRLVAEVAGLIADELDRSDDNAVFEAARPNCPPGKLCCRTGFKCGVDMTFRCETGFRCGNGFSGLTAEM